MSTYCSIQEAWNEPSFSKPRKATPNKMQCGTNGTPAPTNNYTNQTGSEQAAYMQYLQQNAQQYDSSQKTSRTPNQRSIATPKMVETFMCGGPAAAIPSGSTGMMSRQKDPVMGNVPYAAQANDYKYYCDNMGICPKPKISIEGFTNNQVQNMQMDQIEKMQEQQSLQPQAPQPQQTQGCQMSDQSTTYQYPVSDLCKQQFDNVMKVYLNNGQTNNQNNASSKQNAEMTNINGLYDDEISQYMRVQDMGLPYPTTTSIYDNANFPSLQVPKPPQTSTPESFDNNRTLSSPSTFQPASNTALTQAQGKFSTITSGSHTLLNNQNSTDLVIEQKETKEQKEPTSKWQYIMDTVLFIAAGVLIIILCDLLFKIAYSVGMRDTFTMMQPYITEIDELKAKIAELVPEEID